MQEVMSGKRQVRPSTLLRQTGEWELLTDNCVRDDLLWPPTMTSLSLVGTSWGLLQLRAWPLVGCAACWCGTTHVLIKTARWHNTACTPLLHNTACTYWEPPNACVDEESQHQFLACLSYSQ